MKGFEINSIFVLLSTEMNHQNIKNPEYFPLLGNQHNIPLATNCIFILRIKIHPCK